MNYLLIYVKFIDQIKVNHDKTKSNTTSSLTPLSQK